MSSHTTAGPYSALRAVDDNLPNNVHDANVAIVSNVALVRQQWFGVWEASQRHECASPCDNIDPEALELVGSLEDDFIDFGDCEEEKMSPTAHARDLSQRRPHSSLAVESWPSTTQEATHQGLDLGPQAVARAPHKRTRDEYQEADAAALPPTKRLRELQDPAPVPQTTDEENGVPEASPAATTGDDGYAGPLEDVFPISNAALEASEEAEQDGADEESTGAAEDAEQGLGEQAEDDSEDENVEPHVPRPRRSNAELAATTLPLPLCQCGAPGCQFWLSPSKGDKTRGHVKSHYPADATDPKSRLQLACVWAGCHTVISGHQMARHVEEAHVGFAMICPACDWKGSRSKDQSQHWDRKHPGWRQLWG